jgi:nitrogen-specific signal transduction histidine kinase/CheY-like chemotaxis protein
MLPVLNSHDLAQSVSTLWNSSLYRPDATCETDDDTVRAALEATNDGVGVYEKDRLIAFNSRFAMLNAAIGRVTAIGIRKFSDEGDRTSLIGSVAPLRTAAAGSPQATSDAAPVSVRGLPDGSIYHVFERPMPNQRVAVIWTDVTAETKPVSNPGDRIDTSAIGATRPTTEQPQADRSSQPITCAVSSYHQDTGDADPLMSGIVHDLNNMLAAALGCLRAVQSGLEDRPALQEAARSAALATARAVTLANQLLQPPTPSLTRSHRWPVVRANQLLTQLRDLLQRVAGDRVTLDYHLADDVWATSLDASQLESALLNLVINARHAMDGNGSITVRTANIVIGHGDVGPGLKLTPGEFVEISVTDTGCGMPAQLMSRIFEPFFTTKPEGEGSGLGLSMVLRTVEEAGGTMTVESELGRGTSFRLYLPRLRTLPCEPPPAPQHEAELTSGGAGATLLVVEDDADLRALAADLLEDAGFTVLQAANGAEAVNTLRDRDDIALVFSDVTMPGGVSGIDLARIVHAHWSQIPVLLTSGYCGDLVSRHDIPGVAKTIQKPYDANVLIGTIRQLLNGATRCGDLSFRPLHEIVS